jgi:phosphate transport system substrate-binding protein
MKRLTRNRLVRPPLALLTTIATTLLCTVLPAQAGTVTETGSTLIYPLMNIWANAFKHVDPAIALTTEGSGSGAGISQAISGVIAIGASDAYMSDGEMKATPLLNIPLAISAQQVNYNVPEVGKLHIDLSGPVLADIYSGTVAYWNDPKIVALNHELADKLPHQRIVPIRRADGSGDTFLFTQYLSASTPTWKSGPGYGTTISWPAVSGIVGATGNPGMIEACTSTKYSIAYIGISFIGETDAAGLGYAALQNRAGDFVLPTADNIRSAAAELVIKTPADGRLSLIYAAGRTSYPIVNHEYAMVKQQQPEAQTAADVKRFLDWALSSDGGQKAEYLDQVHFLPLPAKIDADSRSQVAKSR